jgi:hypothetical protein
MSSYPDPAGVNAAVATDDPEIIRRHIDATRADLSRNVDALTEKVSPGRMVGRNVEKAKSKVSSVKESVMGSDDRYDDGALGSAGAKASAMAASVGDTAAAAPSVARRKTQGNPLAAGLVAFGIGWLASSLVPASREEQQAADAVKEVASEHSDTLTAPLKESAAAAKDNLTAPAQGAVSAVKDSASDAASTVRGEASAAKDDIAGSARDGAAEVRDTPTY